VSLQVATLVETDCTEGQLFKERCIEMQNISIMLMSEKYSLIVILPRLQKLVIPILYMWVDLSKVEN
jgi:hypothetical protein